MDTKDSFNSSKPFFSIVLTTFTNTAGFLAKTCLRSFSAASSPIQSDLFKIMQYGSFFSSIKETISSSFWGSPLFPDNVSFSRVVISMTTSAISVLFKTCTAFSTRFLPSSPLSSSPGVSINIHGPSGKISIALYTGSVVVPFVSDTIARDCPVTAFNILDFPAFRFPKIAICKRSPCIVACNPISSLQSTQNAQDSKNFCLSLKQKTYSLICPFPLIKYFCVVNSLSPIGPLT